MFRGYWDNRPKNLIALTFGVFLIIFLLGMIFYSGHMTGYIGGHKDYNSTQYATHAEKEISETCLLLKPVAKAKCIREVVEATQENERSERDIVAQESMSLWALWMAVISGITGFVTLVGIFYIRKTLIETRQISLNETRAYVHAEDADLHWGQSMENPKIHIKIKNCGATPAKWFSVRSECFLREYDTENQPFQINQNIKEHRWNALGGGTDLVTAFGSESDIKIIKKAHIEREKYLLEVLGVVTYETYFGEIFETQFCFVAKHLGAYRGMIIKNDPNIVLTKDTLPAMMAEREGMNFTSKSRIEKPIPLQRGDFILESYKKIQQK